MARSAAPVDETLRLLRRLRGAPAPKPADDLRPVRAAFLVRDHPDFTHPALEFASEPPKLHDPVFLAGHGTGKPAEILHVTGHLTLLGASTLHISAPLLHGMSGSPIITPSLHLLALATHSPKDSDSAVALRVATEAISSLESSH